METKKVKTEEEKTDKILKLAVSIVGGLTCIVFAVMMFK